MKTGKIKKTKKNAFTLRDLLKCITMTDPHTLDKEVLFQTFERSDLNFLSIYEANGKVYIDIGTDEE
jgi:hypothetical protein